jgi:hypothetical protein
MIEQFVSGAFWDIIAMGAIAIMSYIAWLLRTTVKRMELYDLALFGNTETKTTGLLDKVCEHEKRIDKCRAAFITTIAELTKKGVVICEGELKDIVKELKSES